MSKSDNINPCVTITGKTYVSVSHIEDVPSWGSIQAGVFRRIQAIDVGDGETTSLEVKVSHLGSEALTASLSVEVTINPDQLNDLIKTLSQIKDAQEQHRAEKAEREESQK